MKAINMNVKSLARLLSVLTLLGAFLLPVESVISWVFFSEFHTLQLFDYVVNFDVETVSISARIVGGSLAVAMASIKAFGLISIRQTFLEAAQGRALSLRSVSYFRRFAMISVIVVILNVLQNSANSVILTWGQAVGERSLTITFGSAETQALFSALLFVFVTHVLAEGCKAKEDNAAFI